MRESDRDNRVDLTSWGWDGGWATALQELGAGNVEMARVTEQNRDRWAIQTRTGPAAARLPSGKAITLPVTGDWVAIEPGPEPTDPWFITHVLPRRSRFSRGSAGDGNEEQVLAANIDLVWIVHGLDISLNHRRLERYIAMAWESGAAPEVILTKSDLCADLETAVASIATIAVGVPLRVVSSEDPDLVRTLRETLEPGRTIALLGPSGVGKSTLINLLAGQELAATGEVRARDRKGRHTTTNRELFQIPGGALLLDTPGIRGLRVWDLGDSLEQTFPEIEELAQHCRFRDCRHEKEPGCAVLGAVDAGRLEPARLESYRTLVAEAAFQKRKIDLAARNALAAQAKSAMKTLKYHPKYKDRP